MSKTYTELIQYPTMQQRIEYLMIHGRVGYETFGYDRVFNQMLYNSADWDSIRRRIILRDNGCDLAMPGYEILEKKIIVHHINPITMKDIEELNPVLFDPENLITTSHATHNIIHYGIKSNQPLVYQERTPFDMIPWKR